MKRVRRKALLLDRDGVINVERNYVHRRDAFEFVPGIFDLCRSAQRLDYLLIVVTNQAGIGRGYFSEADFVELMDWMIDKFAQNDVRIARSYHCPYHPVFGVGEYKRESFDRKPNPGMLLRAKSELDLDLGSSILIGDKLSDIQAGRAAGVGTAILFTSEPVTSMEEMPCYVFFSLDDIRRTFFSTEIDLPRGQEAGVAGLLEPAVRQRGAKNQIR